jgi:hypothetical protein
MIGKRKRKRKEMPLESSNYLSKLHALLPTPKAQ